MSATEVVFVAWVPSEPAAGLDGEQATVSICVSSEAHAQSVVDDKDFSEALVLAFSKLWAVSPRQVRIMHVGDDDDDDTDD